LSSFILRPPPLILRPSLPHRERPLERVTSLCRSFTLTVSVSFGSCASGFASFHSHTPCAVPVNFPARSSPGLAPSMAKSAVTRKLSGFRPLP
jgi:hypothetical protein